MKRLLPILAILALLPGLAFAGHGNEGDPGLNSMALPTDDPIVLEAPEPHPALDRSERLRQLIESGRIYGLRIAFKLK